MTTPPAPRECFNLCTGCAKIEDCRLWSSRIDIIGQNGNTGEHYELTGNGDMYMDSKEQGDIELNREGLILEVTEEIWRVMKRRKITKAELAQRVGCGKSHITQLLNGGRNMTLRTLADICTALEHKPRFRLADNRETK